MAYIDACVGGVGIPFFQLVGRLDAAPLVTDACQPRTCRTSLDITLGEGGGKGEMAMVEGVVGSKVGNLQRDVVGFQPAVDVAAVNVACQRFGTLVTEVKTDAAAVIVEVELIVLVNAFPFRGVDGNSYTYASVDGC